MHANCFFLASLLSCLEAPRKVPLQGSGQAWHWHRHRRLPPRSVGEMGEMGHWQDAWRLVLARWGASYRRQRRWRLVLARRGASYTAECLHMQTLATLCTHCPNACADECSCAVVTAQSKAMHANCLVLRYLCTRMVLGLVVTFKPSK